MSKYNIADEINLNKPSPLSGTSNQIGLEDVGGTKYVHKIYPYRFLNRENGKFGNNNIDLVITINNSKDILGKLVDALDYDEIYNAYYFSLNITEELEMQLSANKEKSQLSGDILATSNLTGWTTAPLDFRNLTQRADGVFQLDSSYVWVCTIDEPFSQDKFDNEKQYVYFFTDITPELDPESLEFIREHDDDITENQPPISMELTPSYRWSNDPSMKIYFTTYDFSTWLANERYFVKFPDYAILGNPVIRGANLPGKGIRREKVFKYEVLSDLVPTMISPLIVEDELVLEHEWLNPAYYLQIFDIYEMLRPGDFHRNIDRNDLSRVDNLNFGSISALLFHPIIDSTTGQPAISTGTWYKDTQLATKWPDINVTFFGNEIMRYICDQVLITYLVNTGFASLPPASGTGSLITGGLDPAAKVGYKNTGVSELNRGQINKLSLVDRLYQQFLTTLLDTGATASIVDKNKIQDIDTLYSYYKIVWALSRYIASENSVAEGNNLFNKLISPFTFNLINPITVNNSNVLHVFWPGIDKATGANDENFNNGVFKYADNVALQVAVQSEWFDIGYGPIGAFDKAIDTYNPYNKTQWTNAPADYDLPAIFPRRGHFELSTPLVRYAEKAFTFPLMPDELTEAKKSALPGDISTMDDSALSYIGWMSLPTQRAFSLWNNYNYYTSPANSTKRTGTNIYEGESFDFEDNGIELPRTKADAQKVLETYFTGIFKKPGVTEVSVNTDWTWEVKPISDLSQQYSPSLFTSGVMRSNVPTTEQGSNPFVDGNLAIITHQVEWARKDTTSPATASGSYDALGPFRNSLENYYIPGIFEKANIESMISILTRVDNYNYYLFYFDIGVWAAIKHNAAFSGVVWNYGDGDIGAPGIGDLSSNRRLTLHDLSKYPVSAQPALQKLAEIFWTCYFQWPLSIDFPSIVASNAILGGQSPLVRAGGEEKPITLDLWANKTRSGITSGFLYDEFNNGHILNAAVQRTNIVINNITVTVKGTFEEWTPINVKYQMSKDEYIFERWRKIGHSPKQDYFEIIHSGIGIDDTRMDNIVLRGPYIDYVRLVKTVDSNRLQLDDRYRGEFQTLKRQFQVDDNVIPVFAYRYNADNDLLYTTGPSVKITANNINKQLTFTIEFGNTPANSPTPNQPVKSEVIVSADNIIVSNLPNEPINILYYNSTGTAVQQLVNDNKNWYFKGFDIYRYDTNNQQVKVSVNATQRMPLSNQTASAEIKIAWPQDVNDAQVTRRLALI